MAFWIITFLLALIASAVMATALLRARAATAEGDESATYDLQVYRDQLKDVDRDLARGVIAETDAERVRTEISRRILAADSAARSAAAPARSGATLSYAAVALVALVVIGGSLLLYRDLGAPGYSDLGLKQRYAMAESLRTTRPGQAEAEANVPDATPDVPLSEDYLKLVQQLRETVAQRPDDLEGLQLLARHEAATGHFSAAAKAQGRVIDLLGDKASARDLANLADMLVLAAGGYVSPEAEAALDKALHLDPTNGPARYYWGLMLAQTGRPDQAFGIWDKLLREGPADAPWIVPVRAQIEDLALRAGVNNYAPPAPPADLRGPSAADVAAARDMTAEDRTEMIRGMVESLSTRLADEGGSPAEWARLISSLGVLGETDRARAIYGNAQQAFAGDDAALSEIDAAARRAGVME